MKRYFFFMMAAWLMISSCENRAEEHEHSTHNNDKLLIATLYHQQSAERDALCLQAYNIAKIRLDDILTQYEDHSKLAIVLDLDETVLDNSPYEANCIINNINYPAGWDEWMHTANAVALPGAIDFLKYTQSQGVAIFYITNRREKFRQPTLQNLQRLDISPKTEAHLLLRSDESSKEPRRQKVLDDNKIIMLFGDNLADFSSVFDGEKTTAERAKLVETLREEFGNRYIVFPNAMYGEWLNALIGYDFSLSHEEKIRLEKKGLKGF